MDDSIADIGVYEISGAMAKENCESPLSIGDDARLCEALRGQRNITVCINVCNSFAVQKISLVNVLDASRRGIVLDPIQQILAPATKQTVVT